MDREKILKYKLVNGLIKTNATTRMFAPVWIAQNRDMIGRLMLMGYHQATADSQSQDGEDSGEIIID